MTEIQSFYFVLTGYFSGTFEVSFRNEELVVNQYDHYRNSEEEKAIPVKTDPDWEALLNFLSQCHWKKRYDSDVLDGLQWELKLKTKDVKLACYGSNNYPPDFSTYIELLNKVTGKASLTIPQRPQFSPTQNPEG